MDLPICLFLRPDGTRCGSPAMRNHQYCYHHTTIRKLVPKTDLFGLHYNGTTGEPYGHLELPFLDSGEAIQIGFMQPINGVSTGVIAGQRARVMMAALYGAAANLREMNKAAARAKAAQAMIGSLAGKKKPAGVKSVEAKDEERA